ncbi:MAG: YfhO family protein [Bacilli bacterium]|jgi:hypothetical protein|nr:YfhO family protein [Bacilli bacterium]
MKKLLKNEIFLEVIIFTLILSLLFIIMNLTHYTFGRSGGDFALQHTVFIDYLRNSFSKTHNLLPDVIFNYGSTINAATLYYYGLINPYIILSYLFPHVSTIYVLQFNVFLTIVLSFTFFRILICKFVNNKLICLSLSLLVAFSPIACYEFSVHTMFLYVIPYFILSLLAIERVINKDKYGLLIFTCLMILNLNFFYMVVTGFIQVIFFLIIARYYIDISHQEIKVKFFKLIVTYFIIILLSMFFILPQLMLIKDGARTGIITEINLYYNFWINATTYSSNNLGLGIITIFVIIGCLLNFNNKLLRYFVIFILLSFIFEPLNLLYNCFLYVDPKIFMAFMPIIMLVLGILLEQSNKLQLSISLLVSTLIILLFFIVSKDSIKYFISHSIAFGTIKEHIFSIIVFIILQIIYILLIIDLPFNKKLNYNLITLLLCILISMLNIYHNTAFINKKVFSQTVLTKKKKDFVNNKTINELYRQVNKTNVVNAINEYNPLVYTSLVNNNFLSFYNDYLILERHTAGNRLINNNIMSNSLTKSIMSIKNNNIITRPFIYGIYDSEISNIDINEINKDERIFNMATKFMINNDKYHSSSTRFNLIDVADIDINKFKNKNNVLEYYFEVPEKYQGNGIFLITSFVKNENIANAIIRANNDVTGVRPINHYGEKEVRDINMYLDVTKKMKKMKLAINNKLNDYSNFKIKFISYQDINSKQVKFITPEDIKIKYNDNYQVSLDLKEDGYLGTTIFYDNNFIIKDNNKIIATEKVNEFYLGAKLNKGKHNIIIEYKMAGKNVGLIISIIGVIITISIYLYRRKKS